MRVTIGSKNKVKVKALEEVIKDYKFLSYAEITPVKVKSGVAKQPKSLKETVEGAIRRAKAAFGNCNYSFGIESGFMEVPYTNTGYMELSACAIYDGRNTYLGLSQSFECPRSVMSEVIRNGQTLEEACNTTGLTTNSKIGEAEGIIGILTKGRVTRKDYTKQAIIMALIHLENDYLYRTS